MAGSDNEVLLTKRIKDRIWGEGEPVAQATAEPVSEKPEKKGLDGYSDEQLDNLLDAVFTEQDRRKNG